MQTHTRSETMTWMVVLLMLLFILVKGALVYRFVGDRGQPGWEYRPVPDVPGESPYAIYTPLPYRQHVRGPMGE
ncbi:MAG: hypothetical protein WA151_01790 [Desulfatirhabdiaceae bacterium]